MPGSRNEIHDEADRRYKHSTEFNPWDVLLSDEEILAIHDSGGIIGLNLDRIIMMGKRTLNETKKHARFKLPHTARKIWIQPLINEILHIANHILMATGNPHGIWDNISIGSDFDGMITPIKYFNNASKFPALNKTIYSELLIKRTAGEAPLAGKNDDEILEITDKIMWRNIVKFLQKHYH
jgi:microsomal dipeptidase-like Zn-dependent dipeptidase